MKLIPVLAVSLLILFVSCQKNGVTPVIKKITFPSLTPDSGAYKDVVTIIGTKLVSPDSIKLNGKLCPITSTPIAADSASDTIRITVPKAAGTGPVVIYFKDTTITGPIFHFRYTSYVTTVAYCKNIANANAAGPEAGFIWPYGVAADSSGNIYVAGFSYTPYIRKLDTAGIFTAYAGNGQQGFANGAALQSEFQLEQAFIAIDHQGTLAVPDNERIRKIGVDGTVSNYAVTSASAVAFNSRNQIYFTVPGYVCKLWPDGTVTNYMGNGLSPDAYNNPAPAQLDTTTWLYGTSAICFDRNDNLYLADGVYIRMTTPDNKVRIIGNIYFTDINNRIRELTTDGRVIPIAGSSTAGFADGPVATALFSNPQGITCDKHGDLIVADKDNYRIRKIVIQ
jgi:hypothetical protein